MNYYSILTDFYQKLFCDGLDVDDYYLLKDYEKSLCQENFLGIISDDEFGELLPYFRGEYTLDRAIELIQQNSRHYAKRQMTWWRRQFRN
jgi:tRNA dimethylallyltransferase